MLTIGGLPSALLSRLILSARSSQESKLLGAFGLVQSAIKVFLEAEEAPSLVVQSRQGWYFHVQ